MSSPVKITKDMILDTSFEIAKEKGMDEVSNREIAKRLNCSIRPIYYQFVNTYELKKELYNKIEKYFYEYLMCDIEEDIPPYKQVGLRYIKFAKEENKLFQILFMSESNYAMDSFVSKERAGYEKLVELIKKSTLLKEEDIKAFHIKMWIFTHGIASLIASNTIVFSEDEIQRLLTEEFTAVMLCEREEEIE